MLDVPGSEPLLAQGDDPQPAEGDNLQPLEEEVTELGEDEAKISSRLNNSRIVNKQVPAEKRKDNKLAKDQQAETRREQAERQATARAEGNQQDVYISGALPVDENMPADQDGVHSAIHAPSLPTLLLEHARKKALGTALAAKEAAARLSKVNMCRHIVGYNLPDRLPDDDILTKLLDSLDISKDAQEDLTDEMQFALGVTTTGTLDEQSGQDNNGAGVRSTTDKFRQR
ncbi:hypothetical protein E8E13_000124 [Curvularia kusanoi]|uniref:Uncharacterized protein n=1 Tax=Curvularia kusanoi TaxID=90978 RepID=A0A9P4T3R7_CURKU|nr:hypothetical protein E8E13_000124 [Curvularia kusanoi]